VDESKAQKLKIGALVVLGIACLAVAVPRFINTKGGAPKASPTKAAGTADKDGTAARAQNAKKDAAEALVAAPYPVSVGEAIVKDPFSPSIQGLLGGTTPPPSDPFEGQDFSQQDFPWNTTPPGNIRPPSGGGVGPPVNPADSGPSLRLTGVLKGPKDIAIIRTDITRYYAGVGDVLGGGYRVVSIAQDRVTLSGPGGTRVLVLGRS
jgi:hypothetical protein